MTTRILWMVVLAVLMTTLETEAAADDEIIDLDTRISLELTGAPAVDVFSSFASLVEAEPDLDPELEGVVTIQLNNVSARTTMNAVCEMLNCKWWITERPPLRLRVKNLEATSSEAKKPSGSLDTVVSLSLSDAPVEGVSNRSPRSVTGS